mmetsp:Transcript_67146/g.120924  ORF Transcript_67146/g.120924 Transcript_67146/m.120924 type:complete len:200 (-) Transcript_67146:1084-1683(-)
MASSDLSCGRGTQSASRPSRKICPDSGSIIRKQARNRVDLPLPVRPQTASFSPAQTVRLRPFRTGGRFGWYLKWMSMSSSAGKSDTLANSELGASSPSAELDLTQAAWSQRPPSQGRSAYSATRCTPPKNFSRVLLHQRNKGMRCAKPAERARAIPPSSGVRRPARAKISTDTPISKVSEGMHRTVRRDTPNLSVAWIQ